MKTIMTVTGIRPDFVRMSEVFRKLDAEPDFKHVLVHTGQHYDPKLSNVFFDELDIREPDFNLCAGGPGKTHYQVAGEVTNKLFDDVIGRAGIRPDIILFLGDSNSVVCSVALKKEGFKIGHIEAGMRSGDRRMLEEINRTVCDHCSDLLFVYHDDYARNLYREHIEDGVHVVGNTIVEVAKKYGEHLLKADKAKDFILLDIHRPENFKDRNRLVSILHYAVACSGEFNLPVRFLKFKRTVDAMTEFGLLHYVANVAIEPVDLMSYKEFLAAQYNCLFMISDSGTAQEEPALLNTPVIVPRDYTERPQSMDHNCSFLLHATSGQSWSNSWAWLFMALRVDNFDSGWLGDGTTSQQIVDILKKEL